MHISWKTSNTPDGTIELPAQVEVTLSNNKSIIFTKDTVTRCIEFLRKDFKHQDAIYVFAMESQDGILGFHIFLNPAKKQILVPPSALRTAKTHPGGGSIMQQIFEQIASRQGYALMVCIAAGATTGFSERVRDILRGEGYYLGPPTDDGERQYGVHQSTYTNNGIPEMGVPHDAMTAPQQMS